MTQARHPQAAGDGRVQPPLLISSRYSEGQAGPSDASDTLCSQKKKKQRKSPRQGLRQADRTDSTGPAPSGCVRSKSLLCVASSVPTPPPPQGGGTWMQVLSRASQRASPARPRAVLAAALSTRLWSFNLSCLVSLAVLFCEWRIWRHGKSL